MNINERIKSLRKSIGLTQEEFSSKIKISRANLGSIEVGRINVTNRVIFDISNTFNINEEWLRTGNGEMYKTTKEFFMDQLSQQYDLGQYGRKILEFYLELPKEQKEVIEHLLMQFVESAAQNKLSGNVTEEFAADLDIEDKVASFRKELETEKNLKMYQVLQGTEKIESA